MTFIDIINKPAPKAPLKTFNSIKERDVFIRKLSKKIITIRRPITVKEIRNILIREYGVYRCEHQIRTIINKNIDTI